MPRHGQAITQRVQIGREPADCWMWLGPTTPAGHGKITFCGRDELAHRWLWAQLFGPIPAGAVVYSTCGTKGCINPHHLACDHQATACRKSVQTKLMAADVAEIRTARASGETGLAAKLAQRFGVSQRTIWDIWAGRSWARARKFRGPKKPASD